MSSIKPFFFIQTLLIILLMTSCAGTKTFNNRGIQKRKYNKGWFINKSYRPRSVGATKKNDSPEKESLSVRKHKVVESNIQIEKINHQSVLIKEDSLIDQAVISDTKESQQLNSHTATLSMQKENYLNYTPRSKAMDKKQYDNRKGELYSSDRNRSRLNFIGFLVCFTIGLTCLILFFTINNYSIYMLYFIMVAMSAGAAALGFGIRALIYM